MNKAKPLTGTVTSAELCTPVPQVQIVRRNANGKILEETRSNDHGEWKLRQMIPGDEISFHAENFVPKTFRHPPLPQVVRLLENRLIGYQERLSFLPGETIDVYVHAPTPYSAQVFRHGFLKEQVLALGMFKPHCQHIPDGYFVETGLNWDKSFSYTLPADAKPGLYSVLLTSEQQEPFGIPLIVSTPEHAYGNTSRLLVLASTNTWQSYNLWGGRSRYRNFEETRSAEFLKPPPAVSRARKFASKVLPASVKPKLKRLLRLPPPPPPAPWQFKKLTIRRPFTNCALEEDHVFQPFTNHLAAAEWRLLAWLEREGVPYDIVSGFDLHCNPDLLKHYNAVILSTHSEYWTREMYAGLQQYHDHHGLWVLNISGNTLYREIELFEEGSSRCVSLSFANSCADETQMLGVRFTMDDYGTCAPYKISRPDHWVFEQIPLSQDNIFGGLSLNQPTPKKYSRYDPGRPGVERGLEGMGASGWETDKLSATAPKDITVLAKGLNKHGGADMVIREPHGTRGGMFSASSLVFSGSLLIDNVASSLVKNILARALQTGHACK
ncbi:hypothetical protein GF339_10015 [candidate division KSB3 bacterium]|uniref:N,N-dimethylformamidase beta subunit-like C-terminal domain-containing protein n=1 Tax=candidate division KSB3 bacterium TaxID=2044937 RepID=A0A9D5JVH4_9BACT|nr:hypothetical protein [candidate division KSB3 bacterium]MBD3324910.1 hypothetical protein [candidate division KSB3 bacterium]